ncbi:MAG: SDR family oxidoreductase, partial [Bryobacteraceae bacterium]
MTASGPVMLVTGAGSGLGMECALFLAKRDYRVFGTTLNAAEEDALLGAAVRAGVTVQAVRMDVTRQQDIEDGVKAVLAASGALDGLIHFAGLGLRGFFEDLSLEEIRRVYDVNVFGIMALTQAVLPHMRERRSGRIVITSSAGGRMGAMSISGYASSKFAVEGFAECLALEVRPFNIHVSLLEPGLIKTPHFTINRNRAERAADPASPYYSWFQRHEELVDGIMARNHFTAEDVARQVHKILTSRRPRLRYV